MQLPDDIDRSDLVGKRILHKFIVDRNKDKWFHGEIFDFDGKVHSVVYEDSSEEFHFNLLEDLFCRRFNYTMIN